MAPVPANVQTIEQLRTATLGGLITLRCDPARDRELNAAYQKAIAPLNKFGFWKGAAKVEYRPDKGLWLPQRRAVAFVHAYIAARNLLDEASRTEAALIKMPTGTGKTAVIAALACASAITARTLIVTPRAALVRQLRKDLSYRFWGRLGAIYHSSAVHEDVPAGDLTRLVREMEEGRLVPVRELNSEHYLKIFQERNEPRQIIVSTFNALHLVLGIKPPAHRSMYGRAPRNVARSLKYLEDDDEDIDALKVEKNIIDFRASLSDVDLVIVDEGHHEPAYSWAQAVRALKKPTVILTATPYRNDYKYFQVEGSYVFNLPWQEAVSEQLIREVMFEGLSEGARAPGVLRGPAPKYPESAFVADCAPHLAKVPKDKKVIVRAGSYAALKRLQKAFFKMGEHAVLIHHRFTGNELDCPDLKTAAEKKALQPLRFQHVRTADQKGSPAENTRIWMHESKLLEGVDRPEFIEVWIYDGFGNARELVQQVGRAIRRPDLNDRDGKVATVRGSAKRLIQFEGAPTVAQTSASRWDNYLAFESYAAKEFSIAFVAETQLLATLKRTAPAVQYMAREFRRGDLLDAPQTMAAFMLPRRGMFCRVNGIEDHARTAIASKLLDDIQAAALEAMELEERFDIRAVSAPTGRKFSDARVIRYLAWSNSPYLATHHIPEWRLGLMAIVRAGRYLVLLDTENLCLDTSRFALLQPEPPELQRLFPKTASDTTRIVETDAVGLDSNERALRAISVRRHALQESYFDIAESSQVPTSVSGLSTGRTDCAASGILSAIDRLRFF